MQALRFLNKKLVQRRKYQFDDAKEIIETAENCGLVYPTGTGKTITAFLVADHYLQFGKVLILAHTNALISQHLESARKMFQFESDEINLLAGNISRNKRQEIWQKSRIIVATPQTIVNGLENQLYSLEDISLIVFDEMHMADKLYAYVPIAAMAKINNIRLLGLTASTGNREKMETLDDNYGLEWQIYRSDEDLKRFVLTKKEVTIFMGVGRLHQHARSLLRKKLIATHNELARSKLIEPIVGRVSAGRKLPFLRIKELTAMHDRINEWIAEEKRKEKIRLVRDVRELGYAPEGRKPDYYWYRYHMWCASYTKLRHILSLFETEGYEITAKYLDKLQDELVAYCEKTGRNPQQVTNSNAFILNDYNVQRFRNGMSYFIDNKIIHPKTAKLLQLVPEQLRLGRRQLIFVNDKGSLDCLLAKLVDLGIDARWVAGSKFMSSKVRNDVLEEFREQRFPVLLATTCVEAGIDLPKIDTVINYSMPLNGCAMIQRRGRAGRTHVGWIYYLIMEKSNDEHIFYSARANIRIMDKLLREKQARQDAIASGVDKIYFCNSRLVLPLFSDNPDDPQWRPRKKKHKYRRVTEYRRKEKRNQPELFPLTEEGA